jgi:translation elongation factor EF-4
VWATVFSWVNLILSRKTCGLASHARAASCSRLNLRAHKYAFAHQVSTCIVLQNHSCLLHKVTTAKTLCLQLPMAELAGSFYNTLKSCTSGYATFDYEEGPYRSSDLVRLDFNIHGTAVDALTRVLHRSDAAQVGRAVCKKLADVVSRQTFEV